MIVATAANDPTAKLLAIDGKGGLEFHPWAPSSEAFATNVPEAIAILEQLHAVMETRVADLKARGQRKVQRDDGLPLYLLAVDELAEFTKATKKKDADNFNGLLRSLVSRGRAAGIIVLGCTQKPEATTVPTSIRDLISIRVALHCRTGAASDTILGAGMATSGYDASTIPQGQPGTAYLLSETSRPYRFRAFHVTDQDVAQLAQRATTARGARGEGHTHPHKVSDDQSAPVSGPVPVPAAAEPMRDCAPVAHQAPTGPEPSRAISHGLRAVPDGRVDAALVVMPEKNGHSKRALKQVHIQMELAKDPARSDREIGRACGVSGATVAAARRRLGIDRTA